MKISKSLEYFVMQLISMYATAKISAHSRTKFNCFMDILRNFYLKQWLYATARAKYGCSIILVLLNTKYNNHSQCNQAKETNTCVSANMFEKNK